MIEVGVTVEYASHIPAPIRDKHGRGEVIESKMNDKGINVVLVAWSDEPWNPQMAISKDLVILT